MKLNLVFMLILTLLVACSGDKDENEGNESDQSTVRPPTQPYTAWQIAEVQPLPETLAEFYTLGHAWLSPDSSKIAWDDTRDETGQASLQEKLCVFTRAEADLGCTTLPATFGSRIEWLVWSGDSGRLFFTDSPLTFLDESDVWELEVGSRTLTNRTEDNLIVTTLLQRETGDPPWFVDFDTNWNMARDELYFLRSVYSDDEERPMTLELFRLANGENAEQVHDLTDDLPTMSIQADMAFSPDGGQVALIVYPFAEPEVDATGLWLLDLDSGTLEQKADLDALRGPAASEWQDNMLFTLNPFDVIWADEAGVVVFLYSPLYEQLYPALPVYVNVETGAVTRLLDISAITEREMLEIRDEAGHLPRYYFPRRGLVSADGSTFFYLHTENPGDDIAISALPLPPDGRPPVVVSTQPGSSFASWFPSPRQDAYYRQRLLTINADGWALVGQNLVHFVAE